MGKGSKGRQIALGQNCQRRLLYYLEKHRPDEEELADWGSSGEDHLFLSETRRALTIKGIALLFVRLKKRVGITDKRISPHIFRHTFAVRYLMLGGDIYTLQEILGHEDIAMIKNYIHLNDTLIREQKRKFSPGDNVPLAGQQGGRKPRTGFREPVKGKPRIGRGIKPKLSD